MTSYTLTLITDPHHAPLNDVIVNHVFMALEKKKARIENISWLSPDEACDILLDHDDIATLASAFHITRYPVDTIFHTTDTPRRKKMLISDMDSTIIEQECIDELADQLGIKAQVAEITAKAMNNELDFADALRERVALLAGLGETVLQQVYDNQITLMPGAKELVTTMRKHDAYCLLVSGGFTFFTQRIAEAVGFQEQHANTLECKSGKLTGRVIEPILDKQSKYQSLLTTSKKLGITPQEVLAIGDGANDIPMLQAAGMGVAYHARPAVQEQVAVKINHTSLRALLFVQGYHADEIHIKR